MKSLLVKIFIKDKDNIKDEKVRSKYGSLASVFGIISNLIVSVMKMIIGLLTNTISIIADGINNLADMLSSLVSLFGFKMSRKKADEKHPYGHQRIEYIAGFIVSVIIVVLGIQLITSSFERIRNKEAISDKFILNIVILSIAIVIKIYQAIFNYRIGKKINSLALIATSTDSRNDVISTCAVLIGLIISHYSNYNLDGYFGLIVGLFVCYSGFKLVYESASPLIGEAPSEELKEELKHTILDNALILGVHNLKIHSYGPSSTFATCDVEVDSKLDLISVHEEIDNIESECRRKYNVLLTLHIDPIIAGDTLTISWKENISNILNELFEFKWTIPDFRIVSKTTYNKIIFDLVLPYNVKMNDEDIEELIISNVKNKYENIDLQINIDHDFLED